MNNMNTIDRRTFLASTGAGALGVSLATAAETPAAVPAGPPIRLGVIGCGGRGGWIAGLFQKHGGYRIAAVADYFSDRTQAVGSKFEVPENRRFDGLSGYRRLLESGVDAVAIISPPYFHPEQAAVAVDAGAHVYLAKPVAVDVPGCLSIEASGGRAREKGLSMLVDFQTRNDPFYVEALKRVHEGALGKLAFGEATYHAGRLGAKNVQGLNPAEGRLRNWVFDQVLSGDIITEQNIHTLDVMNWIMQGPPTMACGVGGRKVRVDVGNCWDHFALVFQYGEVGITFSSRQFNGHGTKPDGIRNRVFGDGGVLETQYGGRVLIRGKSFYSGGESPQIYREGAERNIAAFHRAVKTGDTSQPTVPASVSSNLVTLLGRQAAYAGGRVTWDEMLESTIPLEADLDGLKA